MEDNKTQTIPYRSSIPKTKNLKRFIKYILTPILFIFYSYALFRLGQFSQVNKTIDLQNRVRQQNLLISILQKRVDVSVVSPQPTSEPTNATLQATPTPFSTPTTIAAGINGYSMFGKYNIQILPGWTVDRLQGTTSDVLTVAKGQYQLKITQGGFDGGGCSYPGETLTGISQVFTSFIAIKGSNGLSFKRGSAVNDSSNTQKFSVCEYKDGSYGDITSFGHIDYFTPIQYDQKSLSEMDTMVSTLNQIK